MNNVWLAFITGLTTGGISCLAVQGGLLASAVTHQETTGGTGGKGKIVARFLLAKLLAYTILGLLLGSIGSSLTLSPKVLGWVQIGVGLFLLITAARIADIHPIFRYAVIQPPRWAYRLMKQTSRESSWFAPVLLGFFSVLMPCGVTQAMMVIAISSANPIMGALIMFAFVLGTSPLFFTLGLTVGKLLERQIFARIAAGIILLFGLFSLNGGIALTGSIYTLNNFYKAATMDIGKLIAVRAGEVAGITTGGKQYASIYVRSSGYTANVKKLKIGIPVELTLVTENTKGCTRAFTIPDYNISQVLPESGTKKVEFTPMKTGRLAYVCGMGMFSDSFDVIP